MIDKDSSNLPDKSSWRFFNCNWLKEENTKPHYQQSDMGPHLLITSKAGIRLSESYAWHQDTPGSRELLKMEDKKKTKPSF